MKGLAKNTCHYMAAGGIMWLSEERTDKRFKHGAKSRMLLSQRHYLGGLWYDCNAVNRAAFVVDDFGLLVQVQR